MGARREGSLAVAAAAAVGAVAAVAALGAGDALAARAASAEELVEMAESTGPPSEPECVEARISTVDERWGAVFARSSAACPELSLTWVLRREAPGTPGNRWRELRQGAHFAVCARDLPGIPDAVGVDLGVCRPPSRRISVPSGPRLAVKPRTLAYSRNVSVRGLRWARWGGPTAVGRGTFVYRDAYGTTRVAVRVTLSEVGLCGSERAYLAKRLAAVRPRDRDAVRVYSGRWSIRCPAGAVTPGAGGGERR